MTRIRRGKIGKGILPHALGYLQRYVAAEPAVLEFFAQIDAFWGKLAWQDREEIVREVAYFSGRETN